MGVNFQYYHDIYHCYLCWYEFYQFFKVVEADEAVADAAACEAQALKVWLSDFNNFFEALLFFVKVVNKVLLVSRSSIL